MAEIESLSAPENAAEHLRRHGLDRMIMLCDGVFAIAITLAALDIHLPAAAGSLGLLLHEARATLMSYLVSFAVIAAFWISNRDLFARLKRVDRVVLLLTLANLSGVALIPAANRALYAAGDNSTAALPFYALVMVLTGAVNAANWFYTGFRPQLLIEPGQRRARLARAATALMVPALFLVVLFAPAGSTLIYLFPPLVVAILLRRVILPRLQRRT